MKREWHLVGISVVDSLKSVLSDGAKQHLINELVVRKLTDKDVDSFIRELDISAAFYLDRRELKKKTSPLMVRNNLQKASLQAEALGQTLKDLDFNSTHLVIEAMSDGESLLTEQIDDIVEVLKRAQVKADEYPRSGRLVEYEKISLAYEISEAIKCHLGKTPTMTKDGLFTTCVSIVLEDVTGKQVKDVHSLIEKVILEPPYKRADNFE